jgi:formate hydrogenlyase transcriptional activator
VTRIESKPGGDPLAGRLTAATAADAHLRRIIDTIPVLAWCNLPDGSNEFLNQRWQDYTGLSQQEASGWGWQAAFHPDDIGALMERWRALLVSEEAGEIEARLRRHDGEYRWFLIRVEPLRDDLGNIVRWYGTSTDIEDRKRAEEEVSRQQRQLREILDAVPHHIAVLAPDGRRLYANHVLLSYYPLTIEGLQAPETDTGGIARQLAHPDDVEPFLAAWKRGLAGTVPWETEVRLGRRDGECRWFFVRVVPLLDDGGRVVRWYVTGSDIDDRKKAADKVRQQERELREIVDAVPHHIAVATPDGTRIYGNHVMLDYYGLTPEEVQDAKIEDLVRHFMHPDDVETFLAAWERGFSGSAPWETEARFRRRDGEYRWFLVRCTPLRDEGGGIVRWYITGTDIDDRKTAEEKVRQDERELRLLFDVVPQHIAVLDVDGQVLNANRAAREFWGFSPREELTNPGSTSARYHPDDLAKMQDTARAFAAGAPPPELEVRIRRRDGQYRWYLIRYAPLRDDQGHIVRWYAAGTDIDDRKRAEERAHQETLALREEVDKASMFEEIVGTSPRLRTVRASISRVAPSDATVLITGETGTGKELVARAIHKRSKRQARAFVSVNCAAIPPTLIASELFGHEKGAFTGALARRLGRFELADGGTLFLDEIGDLPLDTQVALLRVLQEGEFERVGSTRSIKVDIRVVAATNRDLSTAVGSGAFRADLFYRLNVFPIEVPPLRERPTDIPLLFSYFVDRYASKVGKTIRHVDPHTLDLIQAYRWPGNVRELQNVIERAVIVCDTDTLVVDESWLPRESLPTQPPILPLGDALVAREREMIEAALAESKGKVSGPSGAAAKLGIPASTLDSRISALKIRKDQFRGI